MKAWKLHMLGAALSMAMAATAGAAGTNATTNPAAGASNNTNATVDGTNGMKGGMPVECANLTGRALSDCVRDHNPSSLRSRAGDHPAATSPGMGGKAADSDVRRGSALRNDKSGSGSGSTGTSGTAGTTGTAGAGPAGTGTAGTTGSAGTGAAGSTGGGDTGSSGTGGGNGK
jgi:hypothetical protein